HFQLLPASSLFFFSRLPPPPSSTLFPYTTLFRSNAGAHPTAARRLRDVAPPHPRRSDHSRLERGDLDAAAVRGRELSAAHPRMIDRKSTRLNSSHRTISYAVFCLKKRIDSNQSQT